MRGGTIGCRPPVAHATAYTKLCTSGPQLSKKCPINKFSYQMRLIETVLSKYPQMFHGDLPPVCTEIPEGWVPFLENFCNCVINRVPVETINEFACQKISCANGCLDIEFSLPFSLPLDDVHIIGARALGMRNRSFIGCVKCGIIVKDFAYELGFPRCKRHPNYVLDEAVRQK